MEDAISVLSGPTQDQDLQRCCVLCIAVICVWIHRCLEDKMQVSLAGLVDVTRLLESFCVRPLLVL